MTYAAGGKFNGNFAKGVRSDGELVYANGDHFEGEFDESGRISKGIKTTADGRRW